VHIEEGELPDDKNLVEVSPKGVYSVRYVTDTGKSINGTLGSSGPNRIFAELASMMLPPWYTASRMAMNDVLKQETMDPSNVKHARQVLLTTRDLLDVFSPVYPTRSIWGKVRNLYKDGYELVGEYQDLDHAHVAFSQDLWDKRRDEVLAWKRNFAFFDNRHDIHSFLIDSVDTEGCYNHDESHLFWADLSGALPCGNDVASSSLQTLATVQLNNAMDLLNEMMKFETVLDVSKQLVFHDFRKEIRSFLDEWDLFGFVLLPSAKDGTSVKDSLKTLKKAHKLLGKVNDNWTAYDLYVTRNEHKAQQEKLITEINTGWDDFKEWVSSSDLAGTIQFLLDEMDQ